MNHQFQHQPLIPFSKLTQLLRTLSVVRNQDLIAHTPQQHEISPRLDPKHLISLQCRHHAQRKLHQPHQDHQLRMMSHRTVRPELHHPQGTHTSERIHSHHPQFISYQKQDQTVCQSQVPNQHLQNSLETLLRSRIFSSTMRKFAALSTYNQMKTRSRV